MMCKRRLKHGSYDASKQAELVETLKTYLGYDCNLDATATALQIHRSTLRYRLMLIRELATPE
jgi:purine catabolism regulator